MIPVTLTGAAQARRKLCEDWKPVTSCTRGGEYKSNSSATTTCRSVQNAAILAPCGCSLTCIIAGHNGVKKKIGKHTVNVFSEAKQEREKTDTSLVQSGASTQQSHPVILQVRQLTKRIWAFITRHSKKQSPSQRIILISLWRLVFPVPISSPRKNRMYQA